MDSRTSQFSKETKPSTDVSVGESARVSKTEPLKEQSNIHHTKTTLRRNRPGTKLKDAYGWEALKYTEYDPMFASQEYLQSLIREEPKNINKLLTIPENISPYVWEYEHLRQICLELNILLVRLQEDCSDSVCSYMRVEEDSCYCLSHKTPRECCPMDFAVHTLAQITRLLTSAKRFPNRVYVKEKYHEHFRGAACRLYYIFGHAFSYHTDIFYKFENETSLYARLMGLSDKFGLIPEELIIIPKPRVLASSLRYFEQNHVDS